MKLHNFKIPKLPRKLKKARYGKRGKRKHLMLAVLEGQKFDIVFGPILKVNFDGLDKFIVSADKIEDIKYEWDIKGKNE